MGGEVAVDGRFRNTIDAHIFSIDVVVADVREVEVVHVRLWPGADGDVFEVAPLRGHHIERGQWGAVRYIAKIT